jgi:IS30 family transposase
LNYIELNPEASIVEMDTVEGNKGGKVLLTLLFRNSKFMVLFLLDNKNTAEVEKVFNFLKLIFKESFKKHFEIILTDRGSEFSNPLSIEVDYETGEKLINIFYCDAGAAFQKGILEKNHEFIRYVLPKGNSFNNLTKEDIVLLTNHINSLYRDSLNNNFPFDLALFFVSKDILDTLQLKKIDPDQVNLNPDLLKK